MFYFYLIKFVIYILNLKINIHSFPVVTDGLIPELSIPVEIDIRFNRMKSATKKNGIKTLQQNRNKGDDAFAPVTYRTILKQLWNDIIKENPKIKVSLNRIVYKFDYKNKNRHETFSYCPKTDKIYKTISKSTVLNIPLSIFKESSIASIINNKTMNNGIVFDPPLPSKITTSINNLGVGHEIKVVIRISSELKTIIPNQMYFTIPSGTRFMNLEVAPLIDTKIKRKNLKYFQQYGYYPNTNILIAMIPPSHINKIGYQTELQKMIIIDKILYELYDIFGKRKLKFHEFKSEIVDYKLVLMALEPHIGMSYSYTKPNSGTVDIENLNRFEEDNISIVGELASVIAEQMCEGAIEKGLNASTRYANKDDLILDNNKNNNNNNTVNEKNV